MVYRIVVDYGILSMCATRCIDVWSVSYGRLPASRASGGALPSPSAIEGYHATRVDM